MPTPPGSRGLAVLVGETVVLGGGAAGGIALHYATSLPRAIHGVPLVWLPMIVPLALLPVAIGAASMMMEPAEGGSAEKEAGASVAIVAGPLGLSAGAFASIHQDLDIDNF